MINGKGKMRLMWELEKFVVTRLKPIPFEYSYDNLSSVKERFCLMDEFWQNHSSQYENNSNGSICFPQLTNHEICHEMFWNAYRGRSKMYIQIKDLRFDDEMFSRKSTDSKYRDRIQSETENEAITLQCSLLTLQMLDYDVMMFRAMSDQEDEEHRTEAQKFYRPYLFSYVAEINRKTFEGLKKLQKRTAKSVDNVRCEESPYFWLPCTFNSNNSASNIKLDGYVVQSASNINKIKKNLYIIDNEKTPESIVESIWDEYELSNSCIMNDDTFTKEIESKLGNDVLEAIDVYKIGNGNCIYAQSGKTGFFYDIGFNCRHRPKKIAPGVNYSYSNTMKKVYAQKPSFFILSHWDMDHIAGSFAARKDFLDKDWFAPNCNDAFTDAKRLAKYLDMKEHLFLAERPSNNSYYSARLIGQIDINNPNLSATYKLYMGEKVPCDNSCPNCEGIVIEYKDHNKGTVVLMMGDVNYESFNKARSKSKPIADFHIDYLIAPHHGSAHTNYKKLTGGSAPKGKEAIICCTNNKDKYENRPNKEHKDELNKRFINVTTTEEASTITNCIRITL